MTDMSWEHASEARAALNAIVTDPEHGVAALSSAQTMSNLLKDLLPDAPREKSILVAAAEAGLANTLRDHVAQGMDAGTATRLTASSLSVSTPFTPEACTWVAGEIAIALGISKPNEAAPPGGTSAGTGQIGGMQTQATPGSGTGYSQSDVPTRGYARPPAQSYGQEPPAQGLGQGYGQAPGQSFPQGGQSYPQAQNQSYPQGGQSFQQPGGFGQPGGIQQPGSFGQPGGIGQPGYQQGMPAWSGGPGYPGTKTNGLATAALVCGLAQLLLGILTGIPAIILGHMARRQIRQTGEQGAGMAMAGLILGYVGLVLTVLFVILVIAALRSSSAYN